MKHLIKDLVFILIFLIILHFCTNIFVLKGNTFGSDVTSFYREKKNSLDMIFFGSSHSYATFSPDIIKEKTGLNSYNFATQQQPIYITYHYMVESLKTQKPRYFVLEGHMLTIDQDYTTEGVTRDAIDKMHFSYNKIQAINTSVKDVTERLPYYFNIIKYHTRYNSLDKNDIIDGLLMKGINNKGYKALDSKKDILVNNNHLINIKGQKIISSKNLEYLNKIIKLCENNNIQLIVVVSPCALNEEMNKKYNWLEEYLNSNKIQFVNYNKKFKDLNISYGDFYDTGHLSYIGAEKISTAFSKYLSSLK